jgi:release factor glutamine methyltransferase
MTLKQTLISTARILNQSDIEDSLLEARILLGHVLCMSPEELFTRPDYKLSNEQMDMVDTLVQRRLNREPSSYIVRYKEFFGTRFHVDHRVLIPRPETEIIVEQAISFINKRIAESPDEQIILADIGTGSGAIAISIILRCPQIKCYAVDISDNALEVAKQNAIDRNVQDRIIFLKGNLLEPLPESVDILCANPPYIRSSDIADLHPEITAYEPVIALDGGQNGTQYIEQLIQQSKYYLRARGCAMIEIGEGQDVFVATLIRKLYKDAYFQFISDPNGINRMLKYRF